MLIKVPGGWKVKSHTTGRIYPKVYKTKMAGRRRIAQMLKFKSMRKGERK